MLSGRGAAGFTLVELITTIVILGVIGGIVGSFMRPAIDSYTSVAARASLSDRADAAIRRLSREVQAALPNSVRQAASGSTACIELLPVVAGGRYRAQGASGPGAGDVLDFTVADASFDVLAQQGLSSVVGSGLPTRVAIYNLGFSPANAYNGDVTATLDTAPAKSTIANLRLASARQFPFASPGNRFFVIASDSVVYTFRNGGIYRSTRAIAVTVPVACPAAATDTLLVGGVTNASFSYASAVDQRNGLFVLTLQLAQNGETVNLYQQVLVSNVP